MELTTGITKFANDGRQVIEVAESEAKKIQAFSGGMTRGFSVTMKGRTWNVVDRGKPFDCRFQGEKMTRRYYYVEAV
jgi:hypothetical protein